MNINYELSDKMHDLINKAIRSNASKKGFGVFPTEKQFLNGVIYYWIRKNAPELIDVNVCLLYTSPSPRDRQKSRMPSSA